MTTVLRPLLWPGSLGGEILFTLFGIFKFFIAVQFLAPIVLLGVWALPATSSTDGGGGQPPNFIPTSETVSSGPQTSQNPSSSLSTPSFSTSATHPSATGSSSGSSQMSDGQLTILLSVIGGVIVAITVLLFLLKWRKKKQRNYGSSAKDEDRQPLSASFQPGELPSLPYWPQPKSPPPQGLA